MSSSLLKTKLYIPPPRPDLVSRPRLIERLNEGLHRKLTLVSAPAGFGKTTLLSEWVADLQFSIAGLPSSTTNGSTIFKPAVAWVSLDEGDNDPVRFLTYFIAALQTLDANLGQGAQSLLSVPQRPPLTSLATLLVNDIAEAAAPFVLVLDDYHLITASHIHDMMVFLLEHQPPQVHLLIATRRDPPLPLPRLRVRGQMTEIRADDLRFTRDETAAFFSEALGRALDGGMVTALEARTEGWVAGLQLAALSMKDKTSRRLADFVADFSGSHRHVIDYLTDEVLVQQSQEVRDFLRSTSVLERLTAPLCDALVGRDDSRAILRQLEQANLFLVPLDDRGEWYRYHRLLADFLRTELEPRQRADLHLRAACWFEVNDLLPEAVKHALAYQDVSGELDQVARLITLASGWALGNGRIATVLDWLDTLPDEVVRGDGELASHKAWALFVAGRAQEGESYMRSAEACLPEDADPLSRGRLLSLRCSLADAHGAVRLARQALDLIGDADPFYRAITLFLLGDAQDKVGDVAGAIQTFREVLELGQRHGHHLSTAIAAGHLGVSLNSQGQRCEALAICQHAAGQYTDARGRPLPSATLIYVVLGELEFEANHLTRALEHFQTALKLSQQSTMTVVTLYAMQDLARLECAMGEIEAAFATIREAKQLSSSGVRGTWRAEILATEAYLNLTQGNLPAVERWAESVNLPDAEPANPVRRYEYRTYARLLLAQKRLEEARALLAVLEHSARQNDRGRDLITLHILQALAEQQLGHEIKAFAYLEQALLLAAPEGYCRVFLAEGPLVTPLLSRVRHVAPAFVDGLLDETSPEIPSPQPASPNLTERELDVLRLMATDLSSPQIADQLVVAVSTVRSHIKHIYNKLDAHSRYEAVERARRCGLL